MRAAIAPAIIFLLLAAAFPFPVTGVDTEWCSDREITEGIRVESSETLRMNNGTTILFHVPTKSDNGTRPRIDVAGALLICGTLESPVTVTASGSVFDRYKVPVCV